MTGCGGDSGIPVHVDTGIVNLACGTELYLGSVEPGMGFETTVMCETCQPRKKMKLDLKPSPFLSRSV